ncbi:unnamed protein product [Brachionus calyciflorus]|uniref:HTH CENPB-type domain-containing protein n=1 Tax=Brachionus calyciflorus TaxID=104777 RepID=A0A814CIH2_9BILA|nr:unnamed protein product [Brachionus calyciflorus]
MKQNIRFFRIRESQHPELEDALYLWFIDKRALKLPINDEMLLEKAKQYGTMLSITNFNYSDGWLAKFKKRHNIFQKTLHGESASVNQIEVSKGRS